MAVSAAYLRHEPTGSPPEAGEPSRLRRVAGRSRRRGLYMTVEDHWNDFKARVAAAGDELPAYAVKQVEGCLVRGRLDRGFTRALLRRHRGLVE